VSVMGAHRVLSASSPAPAADWQLSSRPDLVGVKQEGFVSYSWVCFKQQLAWSRFRHSSSTDTSPCNFGMFLQVLPISLGGCSACWTTSQ
jgi:hypothetical protein